MNSQESAHLHPARAQLKIGITGESADIWPKHGNT